MDERLGSVMGMWADRKQRRQAVFFVQAEYMGSRVGCDGTPAYRISRPRMRLGAQADFRFVSSAIAHGLRVRPSLVGGARGRSVLYDLAGPRRRLGLYPEHFRIGRP